MHGNDLTSDIILRCDAILFDLDGVLVDSHACVEATWRNWAVKHHLDPAMVLAIAHGRRSIDTIHQIAPHLAAESEAAALAASESTTTEGIYEIPGARELLERLDVRHWAIVTSGTRGVAMRRITHTKLPLPSVLVTADQISRGKPDPEGYLTAARRLGVNPDACVVVEDAPAGLDAARQAGMQWTLPNAEAGHRWCLPCRWAWRGSGARSARDAHLSVRSPVGPRLLQPHDASP